MFEITVYADASLKNLQKIKCQQQPECRVTDVVVSINPNYYAFSAGNGKLVHNKNYYNSTILN